MPSFCMTMSTKSSRFVTFDGWTLLLAVVKVGCHCDVEYPIVLVRACHRTVTQHRGVDRAEDEVDCNSRAVDIDELFRAMHETERDGLNVLRSTAFTGLEQQGIDSPVDHKRANRCRCALQIQRYSPCLTYTDLIDICCQSLPFLSKQKDSHKTVRQPLLPSSPSHLILSPMLAAILLPRI